MIIKDRPWILGFVTSYVTTDLLYLPKQENIVTK